MQLDDPLDCGKADAAAFKFIVMVQSLERLE
jgi:hypothetical protein